MANKGVNKKSFIGLTKLKASQFDDSVKGRFWNKVKISDPSSCWEWQACKNRKGYGSFSPGRKYLSITGTKISHRFAFLFHYGEINCELQVCHSCDNPGCCNPFHLWQGTAKQNSEDMSLKGRSPRGEKQGSTNLTNADVYAIRAMYATGRFQQKEIAEKFCMTQQGIYHIINNLTWKDIA